MALTPPSLYGVEVRYCPAIPSCYTDAGSTLATDGQAVQQLNDQTTNAINASQATLGNRPIYKATAGPGGLPSLLFTSASLQCMDMGAQVGLGNKLYNEYTIIFVHQPISAANNYLLTRGAAANANGFAFTSGVAYKNFAGATTPSQFSDGGNLQSQPPQDLTSLAPTTPLIAMARYRTINTGRRNGIFSEQEIQTNGNSIIRAKKQILYPMPTTGNFNLCSLGATTGGYNGYLSYMVIYSRWLEDSELNQEYAFANNFATGGTFSGFGAGLISRHPQLQPYINITTDGDSLVAGVGSYGYAWPTIVKASLGFNADWFNIGIQSQQMTSGYIPQVAAGLVDNSYALNIYTLEMGTNDLATNVNVTTLYNAYVAQAQAMRALGCKVGVATLYPRSSTFVGTAAGQYLVTAATNASPIVITTNVAHNFTTGQSATITGVGGNTAANITTTVTVVDTTHVSLDGTTGNGAYTSGGVIVNNTAGFEQARQAFNALVRANWQTFSDVFVDKGFGGPVTAYGATIDYTLVGAPGASYNTNYFTDGVHLWPQGIAIVAPGWQNAISYLVTQANNAAGKNVYQTLWVRR